MKENLLELIGQTEDIRREFTRSGGNGFPELDVIHSNEKFLVWKQELQLELQDIFDRTNDRFVRSLLILLKQRFNGWSDVKTFNELSGGLIALRKNIDKFYPEMIKLQKTELSTQEQLDYELSQVEKGDSFVENKRPKVFISHSSLDVDIVLPLVELFEGIGLGSDHMFCSSVTGYGIPMDEDIYDYLKRQFEEYELHIIFLLSDNYYSSAACLNEMGAAWVLKKRNTMILAPGFEFHSIKGAVNPRQIGLKLDSNIDEVKEKLGGLRNLLVSEFGLSTIPDTRWETKRDDFINKVKSVSIPTKNNIEVNIDVSISEYGLLLLKSIALDSSGTLIKVRTKSGTTLQTNGKNMIESNERREVAKWESAVDELVSVKFIVPVGHKGELFEMTARGYDYLDSFK